MACTRCAYVRLSAFNQYISDFPSEGLSLVYNTFSGGFVSLDAETLALLRKADGGAELSDAERAQIDPDLFDDSVGVLVTSRADEERAYRAWHERMRSSTDALSVIVSTTMACNLDCTYCCQADIMDGKTMSHATVDATASWLVSRAREIGASRIAIDFVGGEPLLHPDRIERMVNGVRAQTDLEVTFSLITNGVFLTRSLVERWKLLGLQNAQVTLDGDETTHSLTRKSKKKGEDSFAVIFKNVIDASELINISLNGNYQPETLPGFLPLVEKLRAAGLRKGTKIHFSPALQALGAPPETGSGSCTWGGSASEYMIPLTDEIRRAGFKASDLSSVGPCGFHLRHYYAIGNEGEIYKCPGFFGRNDWAIGHVTTGLTSRYDGLANINPQRSCGSCAQRPSCSGGCVAAEYLRVGRAEGVSCEVQYFEKNQDDLLKRKYALAVSDSVEEALAMFPPARVELPAPRKRSTALRVLAA
jgi:uncharacterized protein